MARKCRSLLSLLLLRMRYTYLRNNVYYYQRHVPKDLADRYEQAIIKTPLETSDPAVALRKVKLLNIKLERQWELLRSNPAATPASVAVQAEELLRQYGVTPHDPTPDEAALDALLAPFYTARERFANGCELTYNTADVQEYLTPVQAAALDLLKPKQDKLLDALEVYLQNHVKGATAELRQTSTATVTGYIAAAGDKPVLDIRRADVRSFIEHETARGLKTGTIRRRLNDLIAIFSSYVLAMEVTPEPRNPFSSQTIQSESLDAEEGSPLADADWERVARLCREVDDPIRWLVALQLATGSRIAEPAGVMLSDLVLNEAATRRIRVLLGPEIFCTPIPLSVRG